MLLPQGTDKVFKRGNSISWRGCRFISGNVFENVGVNGNPDYRNFEGDVI